jgi:hypothetical protein
LFFIQLGTIAGHSDLRRAILERVPPRVLDAASIAIRQTPLGSTVLSALHATLDLVEKIKPKK